MCWQLLKFMNIRVLTAPSSPKLQASVSLGDLCPVLLWSGPGSGLLHPEDACLSRLQPPVAHQAGPGGPHEGLRVL